MIKNIVFDFGDIFINLDKKLFAEELQKIHISQESEEVLPILQQYEMGLVSTDKFLTFFEERLHVSQDKLKRAWNSILLDFPKERLRFIQNLSESKKYRLFLLSNTNDLHISWIQKNWGMEQYNAFKICFEQFYLSHEINLRKPNNNIYEFVLTTNDLAPKETLFIDDTKENTDAAKALGIHIWNLKPGKEDVLELLTKNYI
ncbi:HAD-IA family hydrolase [uncultured Polaribacter sp.]|jgi:FMN phosphatase YigB (HAD superfamily)|uniref:HAD-IA family hydrolase n=1 Tax=uncultured Polaribacter sp. TaxID=174711 RepID=UPI0030DC02F2|tara:strand:- start:2049 stop:2654 length:606 start_codon:yes stop_codon:yes gene_type:complete